MRLRDGLRLRSGLVVALTVGWVSSGHAADPGSSASSAPVDRATGVHSEVHPFFRHRLMVQGGAAFNNIQSSAAVGTASGSIGTRISFEDHLGFASNKSALDLLARLRIADRWMLEAEYFGLPRNTSARAARTFQFGRFEFPFSAAINADFDIASWRLALGYAFYKYKDVEVGASVSTYVSDIGAVVRGNVTAGGLGVGYQTERFGAPIPLPAIGLYGHYALTPRWLISGRIDYVDLTLSRLSDLRDAGGRIFAAEISTEYRLIDNIGLGIGYKHLDVAMGGTWSGLKGEMAHTTSAPTLFVRASF